MSEGAGSTLPQEMVAHSPDEVVADTHAILWQLYLPILSPDIALHLGLPLVTVDSKIHSSGLPVIW